MASNAAWTPSWDARKLLNIPLYTCVGTTQRRTICGCRVNAADRSRADALLDQLPRISLDPIRLDATLRAITNFRLCVRFHRESSFQGESLVRRWTVLIRKANDDELGKIANEDFRSTPDFGSSSTDEFEAKFCPESQANRGHAEQQDAERGRAEDQTRARVKQAKQQAEATARAEAQRKQREEQSRERRDEEARARAQNRWEEAYRSYREQQEKARADFQERLRKQAEQERERLKAKARTEAEDRKRREELRKEREARAKQSETSWDASWARYNRQWADFANLSPSSTAAEIKNAFPKPVLNKRQNLLDATFEEDVWRFFRNMPQANDDTVAGRTKLRRHLKVVESMRWHPDKVMRRFPDEEQNKDALLFATRVMQVVTQLLAQLA